MNQVAGSSARITAIDGLRGIAAAAVVLYHLRGAVDRFASGWLWAPIDWIARHGFLGVDVFFVISGFVIALSVSKGAPTPGYFGRFILRRSIRLDPPYWSAIALELALLYATLRLFPERASALPTGAQLVAHVAYAQELLGYEHIVPIFWTLCYEIQFYAFLVGLVVLRPMLPARLQGDRVAAVACGLLFVASIWTRFWRPESLPAGVAIDRWFQFFIGVLTWRAVTRPGAMRALACAWLVLAAAVVLARAAPSQLLAITISAWLVAGARQPRLTHFLGTSPLQFLGAISYSIYLYHASVGWRFVGLVHQFVPGRWTAAQAVAVYVAAILGTVLFAALMWRLVERPCLKLCQRVRLPLRTERSRAAALSAPATA